MTIGKLMEIAPAGTMDPTPFIYDSTMYTMAGLMVRPAVRCPLPLSCREGRADESTRRAASVAIVECWLPLLVPLIGVFSFPKQTVLVFPPLAVKYNFPIRYVRIQLFERLGIVRDTETVLTFPDRVITRAY